MSRIKTENKLAIWILSLLFVLAIGIFSLLFLKDNNLHIYFLNVGQGDAEYIKISNNFNVLIDGGPDKEVLYELGKIKMFYDRRINIIILTHPHTDHVRGLIDVLKRYNVGQIWMTDAIHSAPEYLEFLKIIKDQKIPVKLVRAGESGVWENKNGNINWEILWPNESYLNKEVDNLNNTSVVLKISSNNFSVLFTGDVEEDVQNKLFSAYGSQLMADILKVPHHGSSNAASEKFIKAVAPKIAIIEVGEHNMFGHPAQQTLQKYQNINTQILRTDQNGTIEFVFDGKNYWTKTEK